MINLMHDLHSLLGELTSHHDERAEAVIPQLIACGESAIQALVMLLGSESADDRWWATRALAEFADQEVFQYLIKMLSDEAVEVQQCAALALKNHPHEDAIPALIDALSSPDNILSRLAANSLAAIGEPAVMPLLDVVKNAAPAARLEAVRALALIGDQRALPVLLEVCKENSVMMEYWANEAFERMGLGMVYFQP